MILTKMFLLLSLTAMVMISAERCEAVMKIPAVIGDNMVLQRGMNAPIWGWAETGDEVTVTVDGQTVTTQTNAEGKWFVKLPELAPPGPYSISISNGDDIITLKNVLVGDVWICSGQSNMDMGINQVHGGKQAVETADYPNIRLLHIPMVTSGYEKDDVSSSWKVCSPETLEQGGFWGAGFSAVAYFFGREIHEEIDVPVGLVHTAWGGTRIEPWTPPVGFTSVESLQDIAKAIERTSPDHRKNMAKAVTDIESWIPEAKQALESGAMVPSPPEWPKHELDNNVQPTGIYNAMIHPLVPFGIKGAIWYQGESNRGDVLYTAKMEALITGWRKVWDQGDFPFYYVQIAPFRYGDNNDYTMKMWEMQSEAMAIAETGMAVTTDLVDNLNDIHPQNKEDVSKRLARWALAKTYGKNDIVYSGPIYKSMEKVDGKIRLHFDFADAELKSRDGEPLNWFTIAGEDKKFVRAQAEIDGQTVVVQSDEVKNPVAVRFGWNQEADPNLINGAGLPASPFRTDDW